MKAITSIEANQVAGGKCGEIYEADIPLNYLPIVAKHLKLLNQHKFDSAVLLQELSDAGLDPTQVMIHVSVDCYPGL